MKILWTPKFFNALYILLIFGSSLFILFGFSEVLVLVTAFVGVHVINFTQEIIIGDRSEYTPKKLFLLTLYPLAILIVCMWAALSLFLNPESFACDTVRQMPFCSNLIADFIEVSQFMMVVLSIVSVILIFVYLSIILPSIGIIALILFLFPEGGTAMRKIIFLNIAIIIAATIIGLGYIHIVLGVDGM